MNPAFWTTWTPRLLSLLRIMAGLLFMAHGTQKLLGFPAYPQSGAPAMMSLPWFAGTMELVGGALVAVGLFTRPVAFILAGEMAFAYFIGHAPRNFFPVLNGGDRRNPVLLRVPVHRRGRGRCLEPGSRPAAGFTPGVKPDEAGRAGLLRQSAACYLHGSFGAGKSNFMAMLNLLLAGNTRAWRGGAGRHRHQPRPKAPSWAAMPSTSAASTRRRPTLVGKGGQMRSSTRTHPVSCHSQNIVKMQ